MNFGLRNRMFLCGLAFAAVGMVSSGALAADGMGNGAAAPAAETSAAEEMGAIITDRPDFTESTQTVPPGRYQLEGGITRSRTDDVRDTTFGELLLRVPAGSKTEVRFAVNSYQVQQGGGVRLSGKDDISLGVKRVLTNPERTQLTAPRVSLILQTAVPSGARAFRESKWQPGAKLLLGWDINDKMGFAANVNYDYASDGGQRFHQISTSASLGYALSEKVGAFLETYTFFPGSKGGGDLTFVDTGLTYLVNDDFQLDGRVGFGVNTGSTPDYFFGIGASRRF